MRQIILYLLCIAVLMAQGLSVRLVDGTSTDLQSYPSGTKVRYLMQLVPTSATAVATSTTKVQVILCNNQTATAATLTITDNQGTPLTYYPAVSIAGNSVAMLYSGIGFTMTSGIKWSAGTVTSIYCQIEGTQ